MTGLLLVNLGSPDAPTPSAVRRYLRQFLSDPFVVDRNPLARWLLANLVAHFRAPKSARAYQKIWTDDGSPLVINTLKLAGEVQRRLSREYVVKVGLCFGAPSIETALRELAQHEIGKILVCPLYPQYAQATTVSSADAVFRAAQKLKVAIPIDFIDSFYDNPLFIKAFAARGEFLLRDFEPDHILFSFHGLPESQIKKMDESEGHCLAFPDCCKRLTEVNRNCYRAQCFETASLVAHALNLKTLHYSVCFQSRMGRQRWIGPYTDLTLVDLARKGIRKIAVFCPSFVADCLETLEEIGIRGRELFLREGGERLELVPSLNDHPLWVEAVCHSCTKSTNAST